VPASRDRPGLNGSKGRQAQETREGKKGPGKRKSSGGAKNSTEERDNGHACAREFIALRDVEPA